MSQGEMENGETILVDQDGLRRRVLNWVYTMQTGSAQFRMNGTADNTIFSSCFALFIFDLFGEVGTWPQKKRNKWIEHIISFQDRASGYFIPDNFPGELNTKPVQQLTAFCLSALNILGASPKYRLSFLKQWLRPESIYNYLREIGCFKGKPMTGNMAMFLAIFLTWEYKLTKESICLDLMESWFTLHDKYQNPRTGFWGNSEKKSPYLGFQNGLHQFVIYDYWGKTINYNGKITDTVLSLQDSDGFFAPHPGGGGCFDYDAAHILIICGYKRNYRTDDVKRSLLRLIIGLTENQNMDGGFCESKKRPNGFARVFSIKLLRFLFSSPNKYVALERFKISLRIARKQNEFIKTHWTNVGRQWDQSNLWDTWFRCITIAEISNVLLKPDERKVDFNFLNTIGLGWFSKNAPNTSAI